MRTLQFLIVFLLCVHHSLSEKPFIGKCKSEETEKERQHTIDQINELRLTIAKRHQIANMHEVVYDNDLEKVIRGYTSCDDLKHGVHYRLSLPNDPDPIKVREPLLAKANLTDEQRGWARIGGWEGYHPLQTFYAMCESPMCLAIVREEDAKYFHYKNISHGNVVAFGPLDKYEMSGFKFGPLGSQCPNGNVTSGLCKVSTDAKPVYKKIESGNENFRTHLAYSVVILLLNYLMASLV